MEMEMVPKAGYEITGLWISGLQRKLSMKNLMFPFKLISSLWKSRKIIERFRPHVAIGTGGYASAPLLRMASAKGVPALIQEQNSHAGITNKWLAGNADRICVAYEGMEQFFPKEKVRITGNPVRQDILFVAEKRDEAVKFFALDPTKKTLLVLGGSLGAKKINELVEAHLGFFRKSDIQVIWQCGKLYENTYGGRGGERIQVHTYVNRMDLAYAAADFIISRAGALSVSELCLVGKPVIFIPSPNVAEDHQTKNALSITDKDAAILLKESAALESFQDIFTDLMQSEKMQQRLSQNIRKLAKPNATRHIVDEIEKLIANQ